MQVLFKSKYRHLLLAIFAVIVLFLFGIAFNSNDTKHEVTVNAVSFISSSDNILSSGSGFYTNIWKYNISETTNAKLVGCFRNHNKNITSQALIDNGKYLITAGQSDKVCLWAIVNDINGRINITHLRDFSVNCDSILSLAISRDNSLAVFGDTAGRVVIYKLTINSDGDIDLLYLYDYKMHSFDVKSIAISPDMQFIASASDDGSIRVWNALARNEMRVLCERKGYMNSIAYDSSGVYLAGVDRMAKSIYLWNVVTSEESNILLNVGLDHIHTIAISPDGNTIAAGEANGTIQLFELRSGKELSRYIGIGNGYAVKSLSYSAAGNLLALGCGDGYVSILPTGK
jgi:WD40 repeat protein